MTRPRLSAALLAASLAYLTAPAVAQQPLGLRTVIPAAAAGAEGDTSVAEPWGNVGTRTMFFYDAEHFDNKYPVRITGMRFRPEAGTPAIATGSYANLRIDVSTSSRTAATASMQFDDNHGGDRIRVYNGALSVPLQNVGSVAPHDFGLQVLFDAPFEWKPQWGPLVLDIRVNSSSTISASNWDAVSGTGLKMLTSAGGNSSVATTSADKSIVTELLLDTETAPRAQTNSVGGMSATLPLGRQGSIRYRTLDVYNSNGMAFSARTRIDALSWRTKPNQVHNGGTCDCLITLSTTTVAPNNLSLVFDSNHGADKTRVFTGSLSLPPVAAGSGVQPFELTCELDTPFEYDPALGNLVVDVQVTGHNLNAPYFLDSVVASGSPVGRVWHSSLAGSAVATSTGNVVAILGITGEPVPTVPAGSHTTMGGTSNAAPFHRNSSRAMFRYESSAIGASKPIWIEHLSFRPNTTTNDFGPCTWTCTIDMSEFAYPSGPLHNTFDNNHGNRRQRVFDGKFSAPYIADNSDPTSFPIVVKLDSAYYYDPATGPLVVDIRVTDRNGDTRAIDSMINAGGWRATHDTDANATVAQNNNSNALVMRFGGDRGNALAEEYGSGCSGANGVLRCFTNSLPHLPNPDLELHLRNGAPNALAITILGVTEIALPLNPFGMPGCVLLNNRELGTVTAVCDQNGDATTALPLPNAPEFAGFVIYQQWACLDASANASGLSFSNGQRLVTHF